MSDLELQARAAELAKENAELRRQLTKMRAALEGCMNFLRSYLKKAQKEKQ